jgi:hypoxanthine phosphoribosyltransferase
LKVLSEIDSYPKILAAEIVGICILKEGNMKELTKTIKRVLFSAGEIACRVKELGAQITDDYLTGSAQDNQGRPLLVVGILKGAIVFMTDLIRVLDFPVECDFMAMSSYRDKTAPGEVRILKDLDRSIAGRDVLIVEDIVDTGHTLSHTIKGLSVRNPATLRVCTFLDKPYRREVKVLSDYVGFVLLEDSFVVGYGFDIGEQYRNLPFVGILKPEYISNKGLGTA